MRRDRQFLKRTSNQEYIVSCMDMDARVTKMKDGAHIEGHKAEWPRWTWTAAAWVVVALREADSGDTTTPGPDAV